ncbi:hypothetical protein GYN07_29845 (plasmid) [Rhizobium leguminosarum bv. viciae 248]|nr:hypothetical protein [Rhizobium leguminosarum]MCA2406969.1 hypothetical protein [Rhizobium leguminosarum]QHW28525.1 hypothetical protein GYN07_29845 [Rhizobium leguminosarum bv. viciae 248]
MANLTIADTNRLDRDLFGWKFCQPSLRAACLLSIMQAVTGADISM